MWVQEPRPPRVGTTGMPQTTPKLEAVVKALGLRRSAIKVIEWVLRPLVVRAGEEQDAPILIGWVGLPAGERAIAAAGGDRDGGGCWRRSLSKANLPHPEQPARIEG